MTLETLQTFDRSDKIQKYKKTRRQKDKKTKIQKDKKTKRQKDKKTKDKKTKTILSSLLPSSGLLPRPDRGRGLRGR